MITVLFVTGLFVDKEDAESDEICAKFIASVQKSRTAV